MTLKPLLTNSFAISPNAIHGVLRPCIIKTFSPSSGPHSNTWIVPYMVLNCLPPGKASIGYGGSSPAETLALVSRWLSSASTRALVRVIVWPSGGCCISLREGRSCIYRTRDAAVAVIPKRGACLIVCPKAKSGLRSNIVIPDTIKNRMPEKVCGALSRSIATTL